MKLVDVGCAAAWYFILSLQGAIIVVFGVDLAENGPMPFPVLLAYFALLLITSGVLSVARRVLDAPAPMQGPEGEAA